MNIVAKTLYGLEEILAAELTEMGAADVRIANRAVLFSGNLAMLYKANYTSRFALSFLVTVKQFTAKSKDELYRNAKAVNWSLFMDTNSKFSVNPVVKSPHFNHSAYPALVIKDAIADYFREKSGLRPSVDSTDPDIVISLHISGDKADILLDSTVVPLYKRGYRVVQGPAPINEILAASIIKFSGWNHNEPFYDLMCGSGTFSIEAAMLARNIPAGKFRKSFGFERWLNFNSELFTRTRDEADAAATDVMPEIITSDVSARAVGEALENARHCNLGDIIKPEVADISNYMGNNKQGCLFLNPPYGMRIGVEDTANLYSRIGSLIKHHFQGSRVWIITAAPEAATNIGLRPGTRKKLFNGALESVLLGYDVFSGKLRENKAGKSK